MTVTFAPATIALAGGDEVDEVGVNLANTNAARILEVLGFHDDVAAGDLVGGMLAPEFLGRVLMALAVEPADEGLPGAALPGPGALWIDCGRRPGYIQEQLGRLHDLALAADPGEEIVWS
jgi:hypothetical protein